MCPGESFECRIVHVPVIGDVGSILCIGYGKSLCVNVSTGIHRYQLSILSIAVNTRTSGLARRRCAL